MKSTIAFLLLLFTFVSCNHPDSMFTNLSSSKTKIDFANTLEKKDRFSILYYLYYYNGGGVAVGDINNDGLPDIYFTANSKGHNKLYLNKGNFEFEDITEKAGVAGTSDWCTGVTMADVNGDGYLDIYVSAVANTHELKGHNELFINNGATPSPSGKGRGEVTFTEQSALYGLNFSGFSTQAAFFDFDNDGDLDCYVLNQSHQPNANIVDTSNRRKFDPYSGDKLYRNDLVNGQRKFVDISAQAGIYQSNLGYGLGIAVGDFNNDGWNDIYVGNDFHENDYYYLNNGNGTFTESGAQHFNHYSRFSMGNDAADYNNDGQLDIVTVDMLPPDEKTLKTYGSDEHFDIYNQKITKNGYQQQVSRNCLQRNNGDGKSYSDIALMAGVFATDWSWSPLFADFDNDGNKDLFISSGIVKRPVDLDYVRFISDIYNHKVLNSSDKLDDEALSKMPDGASHPFFYKGDGDLHFTDVSEPWGTQGMKGYYNGAAYADLDNDGKLDMVINCLNAPAIILKNNSPAKNYLSLAFKGDSFNTNGIGAKAYLFAGGKMQYQQLMLTRGFMSSSDTRLHFGLDSINHIDSLIIVWPNQKYQLIKNPAINKQLSINQKDATINFNYESFFPKHQEIFEDISQQINIGWKHRENDFNDFGYQYLIPHMQSTRGPKLAVGDVNKDGLDDFFVCGAKGQPGVLMIQTKDGKFISSDTALFKKNIAADEVAAIFFDANNDNNPDLYVVSGGNEDENGNPALADHLYINDGKGNFHESVNGLPAILANKSCVTIADINKDGSNDIFVGGLADARKYGYPQSSYLLLNDGKGNFRMADESVIGLKDIGIVTTSSFADLNNDGWVDLIVTGEWMPMKIFINNKGVFKAMDIPQSTGLWQSLYIKDINGDGYADILAGNWGHNSKLFSGKQGPLNLYVKDFDNNGTVEQVMTYKINGEKYTFLQKDELERALPVLKKAYLTYSEVAGKTVDYMFYDLFKDYMELKAEVLGSSIFLNDGKGNFVRKDLSDPMQLSPIFAFQSITSSHTLIEGGNFFGVLPYEGRYDAASLQIFDIDKRNNNYTIQQEKLLDTKGQVRDLQWLHTEKFGNILVEAKNNDSLVFLKYKK
ncbi:MAG: VCBS repeat-containing protein [Bacteroidetes bacterium]|nr:VCBS repeat-containing protein [Bacteroidota bacterium]